MKKFDEFKKELKEEIANADTGSAHANADAILVEIALSTRLTKKERVELVGLYDKVKKWYE